MAVDKLVDSSQLDANLTSVANAIRTKGGTSASLAFPADFISAIGAIPTGGGGGVEKGSFIATSADSLTIAVRALYSHIYIYHSTINAATDLTGAPYGTYKKIFLYADNNNGFIAQGMLNYAGTAVSGDFGRIGSTGTWPTPSGPNTVVFTDSQIQLTMLRLGGSNRPWIDGATYNWEAW